GRLDVPVRRRADPHVGPRRGNGKGFDAPEELAIAERGPLGPQVAKTSAGLLPAQPRMMVRDVAQAGCLRRILGIDDNLNVASAVKQLLHSSAGNNGSGAPLFQAMGSLSKQTGSN